MNPIAPTSILNTLPPGMIGVSGQNYTPAQVAPTPAPVPPVTQPVTTSPTVATSTAARTNTATSSDYLDTAAKVAQSNADYAAAQKLAADQAATQKATEDSVKSTKKKVVKSLTGDTGVNADGTTYNTNTAANVRNEAKNAEVAVVQRQLNQLQSKMDARTAALVEDIKNQYAGLIEEQRTAMMLTRKV